MILEMQSNFSILIAEWNDIISLKCVKWSVYESTYLLYFIYLFFFLFAFSRATPATYGGSQARGQTEL